MDGDRNGQPLTREMAGLAREFCRLIESAGERRDPGWLHEVFDLLPRLHVAVVSLHEEKMPAAEGPDPDNWPGAVGFSNDGRYVGCCANRYLPQLCDGETGRPIAILEAPKTEAVGGVTFSADDELLAILNPANIHLWDLAKLKRRLTELGLAW